MNCSINAHTPEYTGSQCPWFSSLSEIIAGQQALLKQMLSGHSQVLSVHIYRSSCCHGR